MRDAVIEILAFISGAVLMALDGLLMLAGIDYFQIDSSNGARK